MNKYSCENIMINNGKYYCEKCHYNTNNKKDYNKHIFSQKHIRLTNNIPQNTNIPLKFICECGKTYKHRQSLYLHKKNCNKNTDKCNKSKDKLLIYTKWITKLLESQDELYKRNRSLEEENHRLHKSLNQMMDITNKMVDNINSKNIYINNIIDMMDILDSREKYYLKMKNII